MFPTPITEMLQTRGLRDVSELQQLGFCSFEISVGQERVSAEIETDIVLADDPMSDVNVLVPDFACLGRLHVLGQTARSWPPQDREDFCRVRC